MLLITINYKIIPNGVLYNDLIRIQTLGSIKDISFSGSYTSGPIPQSLVPGLQTFLFLTALVPMSVMEIILVAIDIQL